MWWPSILGDRGAGGMRVGVSVSAGGGRRWGSSPSRSMSAARNGDDAQQAEGHAPGAMTSHATREWRKRW